MLSDFTWNMTGYILKHPVNQSVNGIIPYVAERIFQLEPEPPAVGNLNEYENDFKEKYEKSKVVTKKEYTREEFINALRENRTGKIS